MTNLSLFIGEKLLTLKQRLQLAMAQRRQEERVRKAELNRLDNEDCGEEEEEEEDMTDESEEEEVGGSLSHAALEHITSYTFCLLLCFSIIIPLYSNRASSSLLPERGRLAGR